MDRGPYDGVWKHVSNLPLRFSRLRDTSDEVGSAPIVYLNGIGLCRGQLVNIMAYRIQLHSVSCLTPTLNVMVTLFHGYGYDPRRLRHKGHPL